MKFRLSNDRGSVDHGWLKAKHSFSFASYQDEDWIQFGSLRVLNEDRIAVGSGFPMHPHKDMEIITIMLSGEMRHRDNMGNEASIKAGEVQAMTAGTGVLHSEWNASEDEVHLFQMWIHPNKKGLQPSYDQFSPANEKLVTLASGRGSGLKINANAEVFRQRLTQGEVYRTDSAGKSYLHLVKGELELGGLHLHPGDAVAFEHEQEDLESLVESEFILVTMKGE